MSGTRSGSELATMTPRRGRATDARQGDRHEHAEASGQHSAAHSAAANASKHAKEFEVCSTTRCTNICSPFPITTNPQEAPCCSRTLPRVLDFGTPSGLWRPNAPNWFNDKGVGVPCSRKHCAIISSHTTCMLWIASSCSFAFDVTKSVYCTLLDEMLRRIHTHVQESLPACHSHWDDGFPTSFLCPITSELMRFSNTEFVLATFVLWLGHCSLQTRTLQSAVSESTLASFCNYCHGL